MPRNTAHSKDSEKTSLKKEVRLATGKARRKIYSVFSNREKITKGEFITFFILPLTFSTALSFFLLLQISVLNVSLKLPRTVLPDAGIATTLADFPGKLFAKESVLDGATVFDPYQVTILLDKGELPFLLLDVRSAKEYTKGHIKGAVNVPLYKEVSDIANLKVSEKDFMKKLDEIDSKKKAVVVYAHTRDSKLSHDVSLLVRKHKREVAILGVGWNEWRHFRNLWLPESVWDSTDVENYIEGQENE